jgi:hypothetical protein
VRKARSARTPAGPFSTLAAYVATTRDGLVNPPACRVGGEPFDSTDAVTEAIQLSLKNALVFDVGRTDSGRRGFGCLYGLIEPREEFLSPVLEPPDGACVFLSVRDFVQAPEQATLGQRLYFETMQFAIGAGNRLVG